MQAVSQKKTQKPLKQMKAEAQLSLIIFYYKLALQNDYTWQHTHTPSGQRFGHRAEHLELPDQKSH